nr:hypothetical protein [uncultured Flavobacterium sp.]
MTLFTRHYKDKELIEVSMTEMEALINDSINKELIAEYVYQRLYNRFLKIFDFKSDIKGDYYQKTVVKKRNVFNEEYKNGFLIMTSCSLLIETFASFLAGHNKTPNRQSTDMFNKVFDYAETNNNELKVFKNGNFYSYIRCGLLHQGETYGKFKITRKGKDLFKDETINASIFLKLLNELLQSYKSDLINSEWDSKEWDACRIKIEHIINNAK